MIRVVADTNVLVSGAITRSADAPVARILDEVGEQIELVASPALLAELADVLARPRLRRRISPEDANDFVSDLMKATRFVADPEDVPQVCRNPDDDYLIALALASNADVLVTGDDDLLSIESDVVEVEVVTPRQLADRLG